MLALALQSGEVSWRCFLRHFYRSLMKSVYWGPNIGNQRHFEIEAVDLWWSCHLASTGTLVLEVDLIDKVAPQAALINGILFCSLWRHHCRYHMGIDCITTYGRFEGPWSEVVLGLLPADLTTRLRRVVLDNCQSSGA